MKKAGLAVLAAAMLLAPGRAAEESEAALAERALAISVERDDAHIVAASWNGRPFLFVDYLKDAERELVALEKTANGYRRVVVTAGEEEGGTPDIAIGFANADSDPAKELIVLLAWPQVHLDVGGTLYEVRIFDDLHAGQTKLAYLPGVSHRFEGHNCDCAWDDGRIDRYPFKTIAGIKAKLRKMGF
ncbi:MAG: hypothetical protein JOZ72_00725 [Alphaproteobacteria bacterium]|nr:hypothetical protein [Alphaproteobacteria bacterium]